MFNHRGFPITVIETTEYVHSGGKITSQHGGLFYLATSAHGMSLHGWSPQEALDGAKRLIDRALDKK